MPVIQCCFFNSVILRVSELNTGLNFTNRAPAGRPRTHLSTLMISPRIATQFDASSDEETPRQQQRETESGRRRLVSGLHNFS